MLKLELWAFYVNSNNVNVSKMQFGQIGRKDGFPYFNCLISPKYQLFQQNLYIK